MKRGAIFESNAPMLPYVAEDGNLITACIAQHFSHPKYQEGLIAAYLEQQQAQKAKPFIKAFANNFLTANYLSHCNKG